MAAGLVLPVDTVSSTDAVTFPGIPGIWRGGQAQPYEALGIDEEDALALVASLGLPLEEATATALPGDYFDRTGGMVSGAEGDSAAAAAQFALAAADSASEAEQIEGWPRTHAELDQLASDYGFTWPDPVRTVADKQHALADAGFEPDEEDEG